MIAALSGGAAQAHKSFMRVQPLTQIVCRIDGFALAWKAWISFFGGVARGLTFLVFGNDP